MSNPISVIEQWLNKLWFIHNITIIKNNVQWVIYNMEIDHYIGKLRNISIQNYIYSYFLIL